MIKGPPPKFHGTRDNLGRRFAMASQPRPGDHSQGIRRLLAKTGRARIDPLHGITLATVALPLAHGEREAGPWHTENFAR